MSIGYIKLHRRLLDWEWYSNVNVRLTFIHCLIVANYEDKQWQGKTIKRGQFVTSLDNLSSAVGISQMKLRTAINKLKKTGEIKIKTTNKYTVLTVVNYGVWQGLDCENNKQITSKQQSNNNQITTTKEVKNKRSKESLKKKNIKKEIPEQSHSLKSKPHSSEEKEKSSAKKEKRTFPDIAPLVGVQIEGLPDIPKHKVSVYNKRFEQELANYQYPPEWTKELKESFLYFCDNMDFKKDGKWGSMRQLQSHITQINEFLRKYEPETVTGALKMAADRGNSTYQPQWYLNKIENEKGNTKNKQRNNRDTSQSDSNLYQVFSENFPDDWLDIQPPNTGFELPDQKF